MAGLALFPFLLYFPHSTTLSSHSLHTFQARLVIVAGLAVSHSLLIPHSHAPIILCWHHGPACHCGRSRRALPFPNAFAWCKLWLRWWILLSNVSGWPRVGHLCLIGYIGYGIFGRRTSERMRAIQSSGSAGCFTSCLTSCFTSRLSQLLPCFACCVVFCFGWGFCACVGRVSQGSGWWLLFWLSSSRDMTATVLSNAALEKKPLVLKGSRPCGGVRVRMPIGQFSFSTWHLESFVNQNMTESC